MPKSWTDKISSHRREVRDTILDAASELVATRGLLGVTMSQIAETAGIGRATLYKYFPDIEQVLAAWHQRHVATHLAELEAIRERAEEPAVRLRAVLETYARISQQRHRHGGSEAAAALHCGERVTVLHGQLTDLIAALVAEAAAAGSVRADIPAVELATFSIHALGAAADVTARAPLERLVDLVWAALTSQRQRS